MHFPCISPNHLRRKANLSVNWCRVRDLADSAIWRLHSHNLRACVEYRTDEFPVDAHSGWLIEVAFDKLQRALRYRLCEAPTGPPIDAQSIHHQHLSPTIDRMEIYSEFGFVFITHFHWFAQSAEINSEIGNSLVRMAGYFVSNKYVFDHPFGWWARVIMTNAKCCQLAQIFVLHMNESI